MRPMKCILWLAVVSIALASLPVLGQKKQVERSAGGLMRKEYMVDKYTQQRHGAYAEYFNRVKLAEGEYAHGLRSGLWRFSDYDGIITYAGYYAEGEQDGPEGCLSVPGRRGMVKRPMKVRARFQDRNGEWYEIEAEELLARCIMHETDHLDGRLYVDIMSREIFEDEEVPEAEEKP